MSEHEEHDPLSKDSEQPATKLNAKKRGKKKEDAKGQDSDKAKNTADMQRAKKEKKSIKKLAEKKKKGNKEVYLNESSHSASPSSFFFA